MADGDEIGVFSARVAEQIYNATCGGFEQEFKEHTRPGGGKSGGSKFAARLMGSWSSKTVSCQIYTLDGATVVYKETATVYDPLSVFAALATNDWMYCTLQGGKYYASDNANCPGTSPLIASPPASQP